MYHLKPSLLPSLLDPLLAHGFHPPSLKKALRIVREKPGKPSYDSPSSFKVIVLLQTVSKILGRVVTSRLSAQATTCFLIHPLHVGPSPGGLLQMPPLSYNTMLNPATVFTTRSPLSSSM